MTRSPAFLLEARRTHTGRNRARAEDSPESVGGRGNRAGLAANLPTKHCTLICRRAFRRVCFKDPYGDTIS